MLRPIQASDVPTIVSLMNRAYRGKDNNGWNSEGGYLAGTRTTEDVVRDDLAKNPDAFFLKWQDDESQELMGCVWVQPLGLDQWYLGSLTAEPMKQNAGLGKKILSSAEQYIQERGGKSIRMTVIGVREALIAWYIRRGYTLTGEVEPFPYGDDRFGTPLRDDLSFVVLRKILSTDTETISR